MGEGLAGWLAAIAWPLVTRVMVAMGVGVVTYQGADVVLDNALSAAKVAVGGIIPAVAQVLALGGVFDYMAITSGSLVGGLAWMTMKRFAITSSGPSA